MKNYLLHTKKIYLLSETNFFFIILFAIFNLIISLFEIFGISLFIILLNEIISNNQILFFEDYLSKFNLDGIINLEFVSNYVIFFLIFIFFFKVLCTLFLNFKIYQYSQKKTANLKQKIFLKLNFLHFNKFLDTKSTYYFSFVTNFCDDFYEIFLLSLKFISELIISIFLLTYLISIDYKIFLYFTFCFVLFYVFYNKLIKKNKVYGQIINHNRQILLSLLDSSYNTFRELKLNPDKINFFFSRFIHSNNEIMKSNVYSKLISSSPRILLELLFILLISLIILLSTDTQFIFTKLSIFGLISLRLLPMLNQLTNFFTSFNRTINSVEKLFIEINNYELKNNEFKFNRSHNTPLNNLKININFKNNINKNITVNESNWIGVYGKSGSGKTSFIESLIGLRDTNYVNIFFKNIQITNFLDFFIEYGYYLPQNATIFDGTLIENISFANGDDEDYGKIHDLLDILDLNHFREFLNKNIGAGGKYMSGGEKQRLLIARALYSKKKILIFDESFNSLNEKMLNKIINNIKTKFPNLIIIIVSHDNSIKNIFDEIIEIN